MATETYQLSVQGVSAQERNEVVMHFQSDNVTANETYTNGKSLITSWMTNVAPNFLACLPSTYYIDRVAARRANPKPSAVPHEQFDQGSQSGGRGGSVVGNQTCPVIFLVPPMGTKSGGRIFMPCVDDASIISNAYQTAYIASIVSYMNLQIANFGVSGIHWQQVIYSRKHNTSVHVLAYNLSPRIGFQKRRRSPV